MSSLKSWLRDAKDPVNYIAAARLGKNHGRKNGT